MQVFISDARLRQQAETGVDAVGGTPFGNDIIDARDTGVNAVNGAGVQPKLYRMTPDIVQLREA
ncbi:hypothetical protein LTSEALA_1225 [Salmonella enterica subsp. enterica serovar Alachua str. R6-377]|uniref:Uncharacterized protein n=1 Tax=Salmonella enterica subsp. enterica serovar Alachua str. R6-377 TaxID=913241 RepID=G5LL90_SALET|nr:hypothetical protein LTSEALA_1225 [Salmonella enterica subsp. enterica serovar Alachua str. R6-377]